MFKTFLLVTIIFGLALVTTGASRPNVDWSKIRPRVAFPKSLHTKYEVAEISSGRNTGRIIGGEMVSPGQLPHQVGLVINVFDFCGGTLISDLYVLTAAHCTDRAYEIDVYLGAHNIREASEPGRQVVTIRYENFIVHHAYNSDMLENDISLIMLNTRIEFTDRIKPIRLPTRSEAREDLENLQVLASGWGRYDETNFDISPVLRQTNLKVQPKIICSHFFRGLIQPSNICTETGRGKGTCNGDSGGPMIFEKAGKTPYILGVVSFGSSISCVDAGWPSVYTYVPHYLNWIRDNTDIVIQE